MLYRQQQPRRPERVQQPILRLSVSADRPPPILPAWRTSTNSRYNYPRDRNGDAASFRCDLRSRRRSGDTIRISVDKAAMAGLGLRTWHVWRALTRREMSMVSPDFEVEEK